MPTFDVVSEVDMQEVRNAVDQASREVATRFDFKGTDSSVELKENSIELHTESDQRLKALTQVLEEKLVKRKVSLKALDYGKIEEASKGTVRQEVTLSVGINQDKAKEIGKFIKELGLKGVSHQVQGRAAPGQRQEARRPAVRDPGDARARLRHPAPVHQLPRLAARGAPRSRWSLRHRRHSERQRLARCPPARRVTTKTSERAEVARPRVDGSPEPTETRPGGPTDAAGGGSRGSVDVRARPPERVTPQRANGGSRVAPVAGAEAVRCGRRWAGGC
jgi:uncharacterized protein YajQ (UPF0234 family)